MFKSYKPETGKERARAKAKNLGLSKIKALKSKTKNPQH
jgi:hypothetical protein